MQFDCRYVFHVRCELFKAISKLSVSATASHVTHEVVHVISLISLYHICDPNTDTSLPRSTRVLEAALAPGNNIGMPDTDRATTLHTCR